MKSLIILAAFLVASCASKKEALEYDLVLPMEIEAWLDGGTIAVSLITINENSISQTAFIYTHSKETRRDPNTLYLNHFKNKFNINRKASYQETKEIISLLKEVLNRKDELKALEVYHRYLKIYALHDPNHQNLKEPYLEIEKNFKPVPVNKLFILESLLEELKNKEKQNHP